MSMQKHYFAFLHPEVRAEWDDFRTANWLEIIDYPEYTVQQVNFLLCSD